MKIGVPHPPGRAVGLGIWLTEWGRLTGWQGGGVQAGAYTALTAPFRVCQAPPSLAASPVALRGKERGSVELLADQLLAGGIHRDCGKQRDS